MKLFSEIGRWDTADDGLSYEDSPQGGQRQSLFPQRTLWSDPLVIPMLLACILLQLTCQAAEFKIPGSARSLSFNPDSEVLAASMSLEGVVFLAVDDLEVAEKEHHPEWATTYALALPDGRFLLAGRFGKLMLVAPQNEDGLDFRLVSEWPAEGVPTNLALKGDRLYMTAGATGVQIFNWDGSESRPHLRARFPFVDFSKEVRIGKEDVFYVADNIDTGLQVLRAEDILRPVLLKSQRLGYVDSVAHLGSIIAVSSRAEGTMIYDISKPEDPELETFIPVPPARAGERPPMVVSVEFDAEGRLLLCEERAGARLIELDPDQEQGWRLIEKYTLSGQRADGHVLDGIFLPEKRLAFSTYGKNLAIVKIRE